MLSFFAGFGMANKEISSVALNFGRDAETKAFMGLKQCEGESDQLQILQSVKNFVIGSVMSKNHFMQLGLLPVYAFCLLTTACVSNMFIFRSLKDIMSKSTTDETLIQLADCVASLSLPTPPPDSENFRIEPNLSLSHDPMDTSTSAVPIPTEEQNAYEMFKQGFHTLLFQLVPNKNTCLLKSVVRALTNLFSASCAPKDIVVSLLPL